MIFAIAFGLLAIAGLAVGGFHAGLRDREYARELAAWHAADALPDDRAVLYVVKTLGQHRDEARSTP